jgi:CBS domain containing-hemolysin-like protein
MHFASLLLLLLFFLVGSFLLTAVSGAIRRLNKKETKKQIELVGSRFFYYTFHKGVFATHTFEGVVFTIICGQSITRFGYACVILLLFIYSGFFSWFSAIVFFAIAIFAGFVMGEFAPRLIGTNAPTNVLRYFTPPASVYMFLAYPLAYVFLKYFQNYAHSVYLDYAREPQTRVKQEIIEIVQDSEVEESLDPTDKKLIGSVMTFREKIAREVMVPRVNLFCLPDEMPIKEAAVLLDKEGYSRIPVYHNTIDNIIGVLMHKDVLKAYMAAINHPHDKTILDRPISQYVKSVLYTPETKKISHLLQEFRKKKVHLAIVVDEYGGTEGIVTIEDILEEIVGEIADEYDEESGMFKALNDGSWIVDARMNLLDVEDELGMKFPTEGDYDTVGGYIYHKAGSIPPKGFIILSDDFKLEVLGSNERSVEKVRLTPIKKLKEKE